MDIIEIDGASNRGIDEIRDLREKVKLTPSQGAFKVYIIDEVHMLTAEAFNALLKTLEEPPAHVIFVFATTEPQKLPATILSRCQRFDFRRLATEAIMAHLAEICAHEGLTIEPQALRLLARNAGGSMRDALSSLDQVVAFGGEAAISTAAVAAVLGQVKEDTLRDIVAFTAAGKPGPCLKVLHQALAEGKDPSQINADLIGFCRDLLLVNLGGKEGNIADLGGEVSDLLREQAAATDSGLVLRMLNRLISIAAEMRWFPQPRYLLELALIELGQSDGSARAEKEETEEVKENVPPAGISGSAPSPVTPGLVADRWPQVLNAVRKKSVPTHALLREAHPAGVEGSKIVIAYRNEHSFHRVAVEKPENRTLIEAALKKVFGGDLQLAVVVEDWNGQPVELVREPEPGPAEADPDPEDNSVPREEGAGDRLVKAALEIFGGELVEIED